MNCRRLAGVLVVGAMLGIAGSNEPGAARAAGAEKSKAASSPGHKPWAYGEGPYYSKPWAYGKGPHYSKPWAYGSPPHYQSPPKQYYPVVPAVPYGYGAWSYGSYYGSPGIYGPPPYNGYLYPPQIYHWTPWGFQRSF